METSALVAAIVSAMLGLAVGLIINSVRRSNDTRDLAAELRVSVAVLDTSLAAFRASVDGKLLQLSKRVADLPCNDCGPLPQLQRKAVNE